MKKFFKTLLLVLCLAPAFGAVAYADVIAPKIEIVEFKAAGVPGLPVILAVIACAMIACAVLIYILRKKRNK